MIAMHIPHQVQRSASASPVPDFAQAVGAAGWRRLAPDIRRRFTEKPEPHRAIRYLGIMQRVECSWAGLVLAQICRLVGTPFAPHRGRNVPVAITLSANPGNGAILWERDYRYPDHPAALIRSEKRMMANGVLHECVGAGFGMRLAVYEENGALHFKSERYFWGCGGWRMPLPGLLSPGTAHVIHQDLGDGSFRFVMTIRHPLLGRLFYQDGIFRQVDDPAI
jgi:hypothetical protein